jgi:hypothetical protein
LHGIPFGLGEGKRREPTRGGAPKGKSYPADTTETLRLPNLYFCSGTNMEPVPRTVRITRVGRVILGLALQPRYLDVDRAVERLPVPARVKLYFYGVGPSGNVALEK